MVKNVEALIDVHVLYGLWWRPKTELKESEHWTSPGCTNMIDHVAT